MTHIRDNADAIAHHATWIAQNLALYEQKRRDYTRGGLPANSMPDFTTGGSNDREPVRYQEHKDPTGKIVRITVHPKDRTDEQLRDDAKAIAAALYRARNELEGVWRTIQRTITPRAPSPDPPKKKCVNPTCQGTRLAPGRPTEFSMIGSDKPADAAGRCHGCHKAWIRANKEAERGAA